MNASYTKPKAVAAFADWEIWDIHREEVPDYAPDVSWLEERGEDGKPRPGDVERLEAYQRAEWYMHGIRASVTFYTPDNRRETFTSAGLYGIESDSSAEYLQEVYQEELADLRGHLAAMGFPAELVALVKE